VKRDIEVSTTIQVPIEQAATALCDDLGRIVADPGAGAVGHVDGQVNGPGDWPGDQHGDRLTSTLAVGPGSGGVVSKEVEVELGGVVTDGGVTTLPLRWRATGPDRLFPIFDGVLEARGESLDASRLTVRGTYTVPLGPVGRFGDGVIGRRLARQSLSAFVEGVAQRLDREAHRMEAVVSRHPAPYAVTVRETASRSQTG
jgi:hypothetical protein